MWNEAKLDRILTSPSERLLEDITGIKGDIMILGAGERWPDIESAGKESSLYSRRQPKYNCCIPIY